VEHLLPSSYINCVLDRHVYRDTDSLDSVFQQDEFHIDGSSSIFLFDLPHDMLTNAVFGAIW
jgi:hypothetical protein